MGFDTFLLRKIRKLVIELPVSFQHTEVEVIILIAESAAVYMKNSFLKISAYSCVLKTQKMVRVVRDAVPAVARYCPLFARLFLMERLMRAGFWYI
jgi:hypothetical protein